LAALGEADMKIAFIAGFTLSLVACANRAPSDTTSVQPVTNVALTQSEARFAALPILAGDYFQLKSTILDRTYHIHVACPVGYEPNKAELYPVVYLLDADSLFGVVAASQLFLTYDDQVPKAIIVGIAYGSFARDVNKRAIDFTSYAADTQPGQGGAAAFNTFLGNELIPKVEARYRADPERRILYGQARAGHFVLYSAFNDPDLFWGRIAYNPSFEPGMSRFYQPPSSTSRADLRLIVASGTRDRPNNRAHFRAWQDAWQGKSDLPWQLVMPDIPGGTHAYDTSSAYRTGMRFIHGKIDQ
jgi:uncharacterized protein